MNNMLDYVTACVPSVLCCIWLKNGQTPGLNKLPVFLEQQPNTRGIKLFQTAKHIRTKSATPAAAYATPPVISLHLQNENFQYYETMLCVLNLPYHENILHTLGPSVHLLSNFIHSFIF